MTARTQANIRTQLAPDLPLVEGDAAQLRQVVQNLLLNAAEVIGTAQGAISVTTYTRHLTSADLATAAVGATRPPGWYVALEVVEDEIIVLRDCNRR